MQQKILLMFEILTYPIAYVSAMYMRLLRRRVKFDRLTIIKNLFFRIGVFPIMDHYYEPMFNPRHLRYSLRKDRHLPGIDLNIEGQISLLEKFDYAEEIKKNIPIEKPNEVRYYFNNPAYRAGDGEQLYNMIRYFKPEHIIEIGSGFSTLMSIEAIKMNMDEMGRSCKIECIEPYEMPWLDETMANVIRSRLEEVDQSMFKSLKKNDMLIIDSSHIIRPQGDVLMEYLEILPILNQGVIIHIHDIFTPKDYLDDWIYGTIRFWNEQYLLEAYLSENSNYEIISANNYLKHNHYDILKKKCPFLTEEEEPGAFWLIKK